MGEPFTPGLDVWRQAVRQLLVGWGKPSWAEMPPLAELQLVRGEARLEKKKSGYYDLHRASRVVLLRCLDELSAEDGMAGRILRSHFIDREIVRKISLDVNASPDQVNRLQRGAIAQLTQILLGREMVVRAEMIQKLEAALPSPSYTALFGLDDSRQQLVEQLLNPRGPLILAITGIAGVGKTCLADAAVRQVGRTLAYEQVKWLRLRSRDLDHHALTPEAVGRTIVEALVEWLCPEMGEWEGEERVMTCLGEVLHTRPHLIVIDNLETAGQIEGVQARIQRLIGPSRFLLTSRDRLPGKADIYLQPLQELPFDPAAALLRHHAAAIGRIDLAAAADEDIRPIYERIGGNPLALKLAASLAAILPLPQVLDDLEASPPGPVEDLYHHIFMRTWRTLSPPARMLLRAIPQIPEASVTPRQMLDASRLDERAFWQAVAELISRSLLEVQGTLHERRYSIHRLTETFLKTEIIQAVERRVEI